MARLSAAAPAFDPNPGHYPWNEPPGPPPGMGGPSSSTPPGGDSSDNSGSSNNNSGNGHTATGGRSSGSSSGNRQCSDDTGPVIVDGSTPNKKSKQPVRAATTTMADATRFLRIPKVQPDNFDENMQFGRVKALVSTPSILKLIASLTNTAQPCFKQDVQKNGIFDVKSDKFGNMTVIMFCDSKSNAYYMYNKLKSGFRETSFMSQLDFEAAGVEIPEEIDRFSSKVVLSVNVKASSRNRHFGMQAFEDMAKTAAAKFGKILSFQVRPWNAGREFSPTALKFDVEYDSVKDACDIIHNTSNMASGIPPPHAQAEVNHLQITPPFPELD